MATILGSVLVVDDHQNWRFVLRTLLEIERCEVSEAANLEGAKALLDNQHFDLVILDARLVDKEEFNVEGIELLYWIQTKFPRTKTIVLTGYAENISGKIGSDVLMHKETFDNQEFRKQLRKLMATPSK